MGRRRRKETKGGRVGGGRKILKITFFFWLANPAARNYTADRHQSKVQARLTSSISFVVQIAPPLPIKYVKTNKYLCYLDLLHHPMCTLQRLGTTAGHVHAVITSRLSLNFPELCSQKSSSNLMAGLRRVLLRAVVKRNLFSSKYGKTRKRIRTSSDIFF